MAYSIPFPKPLCYLQSRLYLVDAEPAVEEPKRWFHGLSQLKVVLDGFSGSRSWGLGVV